MRKYYLDHIRWAAVILVLIYHVFYLFNHVGVLGGVGRLGEERYLDSLLYFVYPWLMVLLFLIAGISTRYSFSHRSNQQFIADRTTKLFIPSTIGLFVYQWIGGYFNIKIAGVLDDIPLFMKYPIFAISGTGPLWFIQMLYVFSLFMIVIRKLDAADKLWNLCGKCNFVIILLLALPIWGASQILNLPVVTVYRFGIYFFSFLLGYFVFSHDQVQNRVEQAHVPMLISAIILSVIYTIYYFGQNYTSVNCLQGFFTNLYLWVAVLAILGCGKSWLNHTSRFSEYMTKSSFGLYVVHYPLVLIICYVLVYCSFPVLLTYFIALILELISTVAVFELLKRIPVIRYLVLGIKEHRKKNHEGMSYNK